MLEIAERVSILFWVIDWTCNRLKTLILNISNTGDSSYTGGLIHRKTLEYSSITLEFDMYIAAQNKITRQYL